MPRILITGAAGFFGHHLVSHFIAAGWEVIGTGSFRHKGTPARLEAVADHPSFKFVYADLRGELPRESIGKVGFIINAAAESHVDRSIENPVSFVRNNVDIALNVLEYARWAKPHAVIQISTDEVYGPSSEPLPEWSPIRPSSPYAASKAAQEAICLSYRRTYGVPVTLVNLMNLIGERQNPEKFLPRILRAAFLNESIGVHCSPGGIDGGRQYLDVRFAAFCLQQLLFDNDREIRSHIVGEWRTNGELVDDIGRIMGRNIARHSEDCHSHRPGHDLFYRLSGAYQFDGLDGALRRIVDWSLRNPYWIDIVEMDISSAARVA